MGQQRVLLPLGQTLERRRDGGTLLLLERLTRGTRADGRVLVEAVGISWFATCKRKPCRSIASQQHVDQRESMSKWAIGGPIKVK